jgi:hypothetical protein
MELGNTLAYLTCVPLGDSPTRLQLQEGVHPDRFGALPAPFHPAIATGIRPEFCRGAETSVHLGQGRAGLLTTSSEYDNNGEGFGAE